MALVVLQSERFGVADPDQLGEGLHRAALAVIEGACAEPDLSPERIVLALGYLRATLYRLFAHNAPGVAETVWEAWLERVRCQLCSAAGIGETVGDIALQSGFSDLSSFSRVFQLGTVLRQARRAWLESNGLRSAE